MLGQLVDGIAAVKQNPFIAVDEGDFGPATCRRGKTGIVCEAARLRIELADVHDFGAGRSLNYRQFQAFPCLVIDKGVAFFAAGGLLASRLFLVGHLLSSHGRSAVKRWTRH